MGCSSVRELWMCKRELVMTDEAVQLQVVEEYAGEPEFALLDVSDSTLPPNDAMVPGEMPSDTLADIQRRGVLVPIIVVPTRNGDPWMYHVKDGRRRLRAARR